MRYIVVPARSGSVGVPNKNLRVLGGLTLIERAIAVAETVHRARITLTTDYPVEALPPSCRKYYQARPERLARPEASMSDVLIQWAAPLSLSDQDDVIVLQPTSLHPHRAKLLRDALALPKRPVIAVDRYPDKWHPYYALIPKAPVTHAMPAARQDLPVRYRPNGLFYILSGVQAAMGMFWKPTPTYVECQNVSNIDSDLDWAEAERIYHD